MIPIRKNRKPKRPNFKINHELPAWLLQETEADAGMGIHDTLSDRGFWFHWADRNWPWYEAFDAADRRSDKKPNEPLVKMLRDPNREVTLVVRECLADLLERHTLVRKRGKQRIPVYDVSQKDAALRLMKAEVSQLVANGISQTKAIERVARSWHADADEYKLADAESKLAKAINKGRGSLGRTRDRLARLR